MVHIINCQRGKINLQNSQRNAGPFQKFLAKGRKLPEERGAWGEGYEICSLQNCKIRDTVLGQRAAYPGTLRTGRSLRRSRAV